MTELKQDRFLVYLIQEAECDNSLLDKKNMLQQTALYIAAQSGKTEILAYLLEQ